MPSTDPILLRQACLNALPIEFPISYAMGGTQLAARTAVNHLEWCIEEGLSGRGVCDGIRHEYRKLGSRP